MIHLKPRPKPVEDYPIQTIKLLTDPNLITKLSKTILAILRTIRKTPHANFTIWDTGTIPDKQITGTISCTQRKHLAKRLYGSNSSIIFHALNLIGAKKGFEITQSPTTGYFTISRTKRPSFLRRLVRRCYSLLEPSSDLFLHAQRVQTPTSLRAS